MNLKRELAKVSLMDEDETLDYFHPDIVKEGLCGEDENNFNAAQLTPEQRDKLLVILYKIYKHQRKTLHKIYDQAFTGLYNE